MPRMRRRSSAFKYGTHKRYDVWVGSGSDGTRTTPRSASVKFGKCGAIVVTSTPCAHKPSRSASMLATTPFTIGL